MRTWKPVPTVGRWIALALLLLLCSLAVVTIWLLAGALARPAVEWRVDLRLYGQFLALLILMGLIGGLGYRLASVFTLNYQLDRNGLYINWLGNRAILPLDQIVTIENGMEVADMPMPFTQGLGYYWGQARTRNDKLLHLFTTCRPEQSLIVVTSGAAYAIAPDDRDSFVQDLEQRGNLGAVKQLSTQIIPGRLFFYAYWSDRLILVMLGLALVLNLLLFGYLAANYQNLTPYLSMRFDYTGAAVEQWERYNILYLPLVGLFITLLNTTLSLWLYHRERLAARLLNAASVFMQLLVGFAVIDIIRG